MYASINLTLLLARSKNTGYITFLWFFLASLFSWEMLIHKLWIWFENFICFNWILIMFMKESCMHCGYPKIIRGQYVQGTFLCFLCQAWSIEQPCLFQVIWTVTGYLLGAGNIGILYNNHNIAVYGENISERVIKMFRQHQIMDFKQTQITGCLMGHLKSCLTDN